MSSGSLDRQSASLLITPGLYLTEKLSCPRIRLSCLSLSAWITAFPYSLGRTPPDLWRYRLRYLLANYWVGEPEHKRDIGSLSQHPEFIPYSILCLVYVQARQLDSLRGDTVSDTVTNLVEFFLTNKGMMLFTLKGTDKKAKFADTTIYELIYSLCYLLLNLL